VGTASWTDPTLLTSGFYPAERRTAEARLRFYAEHFDTVEVDATYYALPSERNAALWAERTPADFLFHVKAFAWLTLHEAEARSLPLGVRRLLPPAAAGRRRLASPTPELRDIAFDIFLAALEPLRKAGKLGCLLFQFPPWFKASSANRDYLRFCRDRCAGHRLAIEFRNTSWVGAETERTLAFLAREGLTFVAIDAPAAASIPRTPFRTTTEIGYVRFHGRDRDAWFRHRATAAERFRYLYSQAELEAAARRLESLSGAREAHVIFNNCYADYGVRNALTMRALLAARNGEAA
jgi:uncharacterized protein YecE (DUF72 family)